MNHKTLDGVLKKIAAVIFTVMALTMSSMAADVTMTASDGFGEHSFNTAGHWNSGAAPTSGNNYFSGPYIIRSPNSGTNFITFAGDSLTIAPGGALYQKLNPLVMTVSTLTNMGRVVNAQGGAFTVLGNMYVPTNGGAMDTGSGNSSSTDNRSLTNGTTMFGAGILTNYTGDPFWSNQLHQAAQGVVIHTGNNTAFTGPQIAINNTIIQVGSQANLGGNPSSFNPAQLTLDNGGLRPSASFSLNNANSGITIGPNGGWFDIASGIILTNAEPLSGRGTLTLTNAGTLVQLGSALNASNFTGNLVANGGTLILGAANALAGSNTVTVGSAATFDASAAGFNLASGQTLAGNGTVTGTVTAGAGSKISPGGAGAAANLAMSALTLSGGATLSCDFSSGTNDVIMVDGNLSPSGVTSIQLNNPPTPGTYILIAVTGTLGGSPANFNVAALQTRSLSYSVQYVGKQVQLVVTSSGSAANLVWQGSVNNLWDINTTANWLNGAGSDVSFDGDTNNFTDLGAGVQPVLNVTVNPAEVNFNASGNYTLTGSGTIAGATALNKGGAGTVTLSTTNTYSGGTVISNGVLAIGYDSTGTNLVLHSLGSPAGALATVSGTGTLELNGAALDATYTSAVQISGTGSSPTLGAIDNVGGGLTSGGGDTGIGTVALTGDATISASANWQIGNTGSGIVGNGHTLTKIGTNYLYLKHAAASPLGGLVISGGGVLFWDHADAAGSTATITLTNGGFIDTWNPLNGYQGLTFYNPIIVGGSGMIINYRTPYNHPDADIYNGPVTLNSTLTFSNVSYVASNQFNNQDSFGKITLNGNISGAGGITAIGGDLIALGSASPEVYGGNVVYLNGINTYGGPTIVTNLIWLYTSTASQGGGSYDVSDAGTLDVAVAPGHSTLSMTSLTLHIGNDPLLGYAGNIGFTRLAFMPSSPVIYATNLTINAGVILPPRAGYSIGQFPLIKYDGTIGGSGFGGLQLGTLPAGVTATLVNNTGNHTIDLNVTAAGIQWTGANSTAWDIGTQNWYDPASSSATTYADGQTVVFGDTATSYNVIVAQIVQPGGVTVNSTNNYYWTNSVGAGITGSGTLVKNGSGTLTIACTNNTFIGGTYINGGTIKLADQNYGYPYGGGALNNNLGNVTVANGGTLDINGVEVPNYQQYGPPGYNVLLSGSGVGGNGALVNSSTNNNDNADPGYVTLTGDATVGGVGDINIRHGGTPQMNSQSSAYTLTKLGTGQFRLRYVATVSTNFGPIDILGGIFSYESSSALGLGDPTKNILVGSGAGFAWGTPAAACVRPLMCSNNSTLYGYNITTNVFNSPVTLIGGNVNLNANFYHGMIFSNVLTGAGGVTVQYQSYVTFAAANTYSGDTIVVDCGSGPGSVLRLVGNGSINNSLNITLQGITTNQAFPGALDASGRTDGTLTLGSGQTLRGDNGSYVKGNVVANNGATISPGGGGNAQYMTFSNNLALSFGSTVAMDVSLDNGASNDLINVVGTNSYAGTLQLANSGIAPLTNGASFKLFNNAHYSGNFATLSGSPGAGLAWNFDPATGIATVVAAAPSNPPISLSVSGNQLTLSWPSAYLGYTLQAQTNTLARGLWTNWVDVAGSSSSTQSVMTITSTNGAVFYRLRQ